MSALPIKLTLACAASLVLGTGCKEPPVPPKKIDKRAAKRDGTATVAQPPPEGVYAQVTNVGSARCRRTLCIAGPGEFDSPPQIDLAELCRRAPGIVQRCEDGRCMSMWTVDEWRAGLGGLIDSLDRNGDGVVNDQDGDCSVGVAGWSTGAAVAATELAAGFASDPRLEHDRTKIDQLVAIAPYAPGLERLELAANVSKAFIYRQTEPPEGDCSHAFEGGPWVSPAPVCGADTTCYDYNYARDPGDLAYLSRRGARSGAEVGHCNIVALVAKIGLDNLARGQEALRELIPPYSDGTHGGREHPAGPAKPDPVRVLPNPVQPD